MVPKIPLTIGFEIKLQAFQLFGFQIRSTAVECRWRWSTAVDSWHWFTVDRCQKSSIAR